MLHTKRYEIGDKKLRQWTCLIRATIQGHTFEGTVTVRSAHQDKAEKLARMTFINNLRYNGIWADITKDEEGNTLYEAPTYDHVVLVDFIEPGVKDLSFSRAELIATHESKFGSPEKKRRTTGEVSLDKKKGTLRKHQTAVDTLQPIVEYFREPKTLKQAALDLKIAYQVVRYRIKQITDKGMGDQAFEAIESKEEGMKTVQLKKKSV